MKISSLGRAARSGAKIKVRQPMARVLVKVKTAKEESALVEIASQITEELNVKTVEALKDEGKVRDNTAFSVAEEGGYLVAVDTQIYPELAAEGAARELVHLLQTMRRSAGFDITDRIYTYYDGDEALEGVMAQFASYIQQETLSLALRKELIEDGYQERHRVQGKEIVLGVRKA